ncbi:MAG: pilus assembly protein TadG-related protein [Hyphomicrobium sp.]
MGMEFSGKCGRTRALVRTFATTEGGAVAPLFALIVLMMLGVAGLALDSDRGTRIKTRLSDAADAANLAAARAAVDMAKSDAQRSKSEIASEAAEIGRKVFLANLQTLGGAKFNPPNMDVTYDSGKWNAKITYDALMQASLSAAVGMDSMTIRGQSEASVSPGFAVLDIAMCVDSTGSMTPTLDAVKANALNFYDNLNNELKSRSLEPFPLVRVRMAYFKDYGDINNMADPDPLTTSNFFSLPSEASSFSSFVSPQVAYGGMDTPESGLECLNEAIDSPWVKPGDVPSGFSEPVTDVYPLIVVWTDAPSHPPSFPNSLANPAYPSAAKMPRSAAAMLAKWNSAAAIDQAHKQLIFFGDPDVMSPDQGGYETGWKDVKAWPNFTVGGTLTDANASMIQFLADGIAKTTKSLRVTN